MNSTVTIPEIVDVETVGQLLEQHIPVKLLDVRTPAEFESVHIPGSYNVPLDLLAEHREELSDTLRSPAILICRSGSRAGQAAELLRQADLRHVHILDGGMRAWEAARQPVRRGRQRWSLERQVRGVAGTLVLTSVVAGALIASPLTLVAGAVGAGLAFSALTDSCGMALLLARLPYNRGATCDMREVVGRLAAAENMQRR
jgi:rhodanese-related sulfurtransferase